MSDQPLGPTSDPFPPGLQPQPGAAPLPTGDALVSLVEGVQKHVQMLSGIRSEYESQAAELSRRSAELNEKSVILAQQETALRDRQDQLEATTAALQQQRLELERRSAEVAVGAREAEARAKLAQEAVERAVAAEQAAGRKFVEAQALVLEAEKLKAAGGAGAEEARREHEEQLRLAREECDRAGAEAARLREQLDAARAEGIERAEEFERLRAKATAESRGQLEALAAKLRDAENELDAAREDCTRLAGLLEQARAEALSAKDADAVAGELRSRLAEAETRGARLDARVRDLEDELADRPATPPVAEQNGEHSAEVDRLNAEIEKAMKIIDRLQDDRAALSERAATAEKALAARTPAHTDFPDGAAEARPGRRERLRRLRDAMKQQRRKLDQAQAIITRKLQEAQEGAAAKASLGAERQHLEQMRQKIEQERAALLRERQSAPEESGEPAPRAATGSVRSGVGALCFAAALAVLAGVSWLLAGQFARPVCVASITLGNDGASQSATPEQSAGWKAYVKDLPQDERLLERAAERMKMRGFEELADANGLAGYLKTHLDVDATADNEVKLTLRHPGFDRSALAVDTLGTTIIGFANDSRDMREDKLSTTLASGAQPAQEPVEDPRLAVFGAIYGALTAVMLIGVVSIARRAKAGGDSRRRERMTPVPVMAGAGPGIMPGPRNSPLAQAAANNAMPAMPQAPAPAPTFPRLSRPIQPELPIVAETEDAAEPEQQVPMPKGKSMLKPLGD